MPIENIKNLIQQLEYLSNLHQTFTIIVITAFVVALTLGHNVKAQGNNNNDGLGDLGNLGNLGDLGNFGGQG